MRAQIMTLLLLLATSAAFATQEKKTTRIRITGPGGFLDETNIYFDQGVSPAYSYTEDGPKAYGPIEHAPSIYSISSDNVFCSTNGYSSLAVSEVVPLGIKTDTAGVHMFTASIITNFDSSTIIQIEDRQNNTFTDLRNSFYQVHLAKGEVINGRFFLHVSRAIQVTPVTAGCLNNDGVLQIDQDNTILWSGAYLYDSTGALIDLKQNLSGPYSFTGLKEGNYSLILDYNGYRTTKHFYMTGNYVTAHIDASTTSAPVDQEITFYSTVHNATGYLWELGDSTQIGGVANPAYAYPVPGEYRVFLNAFNDAGCTYRTSLTVTVSTATAITGFSNEPRKIWAYDKTVTVAMNEEIVQGAELKIYNILGQPVYNNPVTDLTTVVTLDQVTPGYYIVSLQNNKKESTKRVFLGK